MNKNYGHPEVFIVIPVRNENKYIEDCLIEFVQYI